VNTAQAGDKYSTRLLEEISNGPGVIPSCKVGVFCDDTQIGEYVRNYYYSPGTFFPFSKDGKWYALYSRDYTATRVMSLPDCKDLGGEEPSSAGFCPAEYYVPTRTARVRVDDDPQPVLANHDHERWALKVRENGHTRLYWPDCPDHPNPDPEERDAYLEEFSRSHAASKAWRTRNPTVTRHTPFGFVHGCYWACPYWIRFIDLSRADEGILTIDDRIEHPELPGSLSLKEVVDVVYREFHPETPKENNFTLLVPALFDATGKRLGD